ncbi:homeobox protein 5-like [Bacillus rossius redtenbacheri]|uniref:homeobox protein 5-like n=1 Tax=Bacillus rossius redtenbacheri TaxID=93214 RepID=UPI002FDE9617
MISTRVLVVLALCALARSASLDFRKVADGLFGRRAGRSDQLALPTVSPGLNPGDAGVQEWPDEFQEDIQSAFELLKSKREAEESQNNNFNNLFGFNQIPDMNNIGGQLMPNSTNFGQYIPGNMSAPNFNQYIPGNMSMPNNFNQYIPGNMSMPNNFNQYIPGNMSAPNFNQYIPGNMSAPNFNQYIPGNMSAPNFNQYIPGNMSMPNNFNQYIPGNMSAPNFNQYVPGNMSAPDMGNWPGMNNMNGFTQYIPNNNNNNKENGASKRSADFASQIPTVDYNKPVNQGMGTLCSSATERK